ncbi:2OG-Fe(II) oxygenase [Flagellimonas sp. S3867]|uniref:2OG-Fe(II) oxygenase n=1 Tax=Flagellimonas sp. S3867 TaxID=2768063 RepID=UPI001686267A|nr:2OG-Fe(II) oxygenase [Flagellimonas sp. S3867]
MEIFKEKLATIPWEKITQELNEQGYAIIENVLDDQYCMELIKGFENHKLYRKVVDMERYRFGKGKYKYFKYPLPDVLSGLRKLIYPKLVPIANQWMHNLKNDVIFPKNLSELHAKCANHGQVLATPLILKYEKGGFNTLHQDLYGDVYFPMQAVLFLNEVEKDYTGGEFVMTQQIPRAQSQAIVLRPKKGSMLLFTTNHRPILGKKGHYRVAMKHGVSKVLSGERYTLGIIFHDASA